MAKAPAIGAVPRFNVGVRVSVTDYGVTRTGTIVDAARVAFVRLDHSGAVRWFHYRSLTPA